MSQRILQAHCQSPTSQPARQSFVKELAKPTLKKIELKNFSSPSENKKYATAQTNTTQKMTVKLNNDNGLQTRTTERQLVTAVAVAQLRSQPSYFENGMKNGFHS